MAGFFAKLCTSLLTAMKNRFSGLKNASHILSFVIKLIKNEPATAIARGVVIIPFCYPPYLVDMVVKILCAKP